MSEFLAASRSYPNALRSSFAAGENGERPPYVEFVGASDETIAEAVRRALACASEFLRTLEGAGVLVIPQIYRDGSAPRYRVTLQVTAPDRTPPIVPPQR